MDERIPLNECPLWNAQHHARYAYEYFLKASAASRMDTAKDLAWYVDHYKAEGLREFTEALEYLGYDLVKREKAQEAA